MSLKAASMYLKEDLSKTFLYDELIQAINQARIDTIKECAEKATLKSEWIHTPIDYEGYWESELDKQSILKLIEEVK